MVSRAGWDIESICSSAGRWNCRGFCSFRTSVNRENPVATSCSGAGGHWLRVIARQLFAKLVVRFIRVKRGNDVIAIAPGVRETDVDVFAARFHIARHVEPMPPPTLPGCGGQQAINHFRRRRCRSFRKPRSCGQEEGQSNRNRPAATASAYRRRHRMDSLASIAQNDRRFHRGARVVAHLWRRRPRHRRRPTNPGLWRDHRPSRSPRRHRAARAHFNPRFEILIVRHLASSFRRRHGGSLSAYRMAWMSRLSPTSRYHRGTVVATHRILTGIRRAPFSFSAFCEWQS